jgi:hypothetical protein
MKKNVGNGDRIVRALGGAALLFCAYLAPLPLSIRLGAFGLMGTYLVFTALGGACLGYALMGKSTCAIDRAR